MAINPLWAGNWVAMTTAWKKEPPKVSGYYWACPTHKAEWLDHWPEVVYLYYDGRWKVYRPYIEETYRPEEFTHWCGPIPKPELPEA